MKKLFGEYLIEKNIVTEEQVLEALIDQMRNLPSLCEIAYDHALMKKADILKSVAVQMKLGLDFKRACQSEKLWNETIEAEVNKVLRTKKRPLGEILLQKNIISAEELTRALDEFLSQNMVQSQVKVHADYHNLEREINLLDSTGEKADENRTKLNFIFHILHQMRGVARFKSADGLEKICAEFEKLVEDEMKNKTPGNSIFCNKAKEFLYRCSEAAFQLEKPTNEKR